MATNDFLKALSAPRKPEITEAELNNNAPPESYLTTLGLAPVRAGLAALEAIGYIDDTTRAGIGALYGAKGTGQETVFGPAPSGRELFGLGEGKVGEFESGDLAGAVAVGLLSPFNLLGFGTLTKTGEAAKALESVTLAEQAYRRSGDIAKADALLGRIGELTRDATATGKTATYGKTFGAQGRAGQRSAISLDIPFGPKTPLVTGAPILDAADVAYTRAIKPVFGPVYNTLFRPAGKIGNPEFDALVDYAAREGSRSGIARGEDAASAIGRELPKLGVTADIARGVGDYANLQGKLAALEFKSKFGRDLAPEEAARLQFGDIASRGDPAGNLTQFTLENVLSADKNRAGAAEIDKALQSQLAEIDAKKITFPTNNLNRLQKLIYNGTDPDKIAKAQRIAERLDPNARNILAEANKLYSGAPPKEWIHALDRQGLGQIPDKDARARAITEAINTLNGPFEAEKYKATQEAAAKAYPLLAKADMADATRALIPAPVLQQAERIAAINGESLTRLDAAGRRLEALTDPYVGYLTHTPSDTGREMTQLLTDMGVADGDLGTIARQFTTSADFTKTRSDALKGLGVMQANNKLADLAREQATYVLNAATASPEQRKAAEKLLKIVDKGGVFFEENLPAIMVRNLTQVGEVEGNARMLQGVIETFHMPKDAAGPGATSVKDFLKRNTLSKVSGIPFKGEIDLEGALGRQLTQAEATGLTKSDIDNALKLAGMDESYIPKHIADAAEATQERLRDPAAVRGMFGVLNTLNGVARLGATLVRPGFYARNTIGNAFTMLEGGFSRPGTILTASRLLRKRAAGLLTDAENALITRAIEHGAIESGASIELRTLTGQAGLLGDATKLQRGLTNLSEKGMALNRTIEDTSKLAMYLDGIEKGMSSVESANRVKKYLFDYSDLSNFEKQYLRKWAFFYTYMRKNIPLQVEKLLQNPRNLRAYGILTGRIGNTPQQQLPEWQQNQGLIATGSDSDGNQTFTSLGLPGEDLFKFADERRGFQRVGQKVLANLAPVQRAPIELATGVNLGTGLPMRGRPSERAIASALPTALAQDFSTLAGLESYSPTSGVTGPLRRLSEAVTGNTGTNNSKLRDVILGLGTGATVSRVSLQEAKDRRIREQGHIYLDRLEAAGVPTDDPRYKAARAATRVGSK